MHKIRQPAPQVWIGNAAKHDVVAFLRVGEKDAQYIVVSPILQERALTDAGATTADLAAVGQEDLAALVPDEQARTSRVDARLGAVDLAGDEKQRGWVRLVTAESPPVPVFEALRPQQYPYSQVHVP